MGFRQPGAEKRRKTEAGDEVRLYAASGASTACGSVSSRALGPWLGVSEVECVASRTEKSGSVWCVPERAGTCTLGDSQTADSGIQAVATLDSHTSRLAAPQY